MSSPNWLVGCYMALCLVAHNDNWSERQRDDVLISAAVLGKCFRGLFRLHNRRLRRGHNHVASWTLGLYDQICQAYLDLAVCTK